MRLKIATIEKINMTNIIYRLYKKNSKFSINWKSWRYIYSTKDIDSLFKVLIRVYNYGIILERMDKENENF